MFADDVAVAAGGRYFQSLAEQHAEARRVEHGATADDAVPRQAAQLPRHVRQHVDGVRHNEQDTVGTVLHQFGYNVCKNRSGTRYEHRANT